MFTLGIYGVRLRWNVGNFPIDCDTESLADGDNAVSQSVPPQLDEVLTRKVNCDAPSTHTRTHAHTQQHTTATGSGSSNQQKQKQAAMVTENGSRTGYVPSVPDRVKRK